MLAIHGRPSELDAFLFFLATELGRTVGELEEYLTYAEYVQWVGYYTARNAVANQRRVVGGSG